MTKPTNPEFIDMEFEIKSLELTVEQLTIEKNSAYNERNCLVSLLAHIFPAGIKKTAIEGWEPEWHNCVYIDTPAGQLSWHYHDQEAAAFMDLPAYWAEWDGHTTEEKYKRVAKLCGVDWLIVADAEGK